jgi:hypothetical protein
VEVDFVVRRWAKAPRAFRPGDVDLGEGQLRGRVGPRADSLDVSHSDQVLGVSAAECARI